ncbi:MAG: hypothetical protein ACRDJN_28050 [Chloroflexota bacterium]
MNQGHAAAAAGGTAAADDHSPATLRSRATLRSSPAVTPVTTDIPDTPPLRPALALQLAEAAYAVDADHVARDLLIGLVLNGAVAPAAINGAIERGLASFAGRRQRLRAGVAAGGQGQRPLPDR